MSKLKNVIGTVSGAVGAAQAAYELAVTVEGKPLRARAEPAVVSVFGVKVFERDESLERVWFGVLRRGKSRFARRALAAREKKA